VSHYCNFHAHSSKGSLRDSVLRNSEYLDRCIELNIAPGLSDHGLGANIYQFYKDCKKRDIKKFTVGIECYYALDDDPKGANYHLVVIAKNYEGYQSLSKLSSMAYLNNFYKKPRVTKTMLKECSKGLIVSTACMQGLAQQLLLTGDKDGCNQEIEALRAIFGDDLYLEIHDHGIAEEIIIREHFREYGKTNNIKVVPGLDSHYLLDTDKSFHNIFKQIAYNSIGQANDDGGFSGAGYHIWSHKEIITKFEQSEIDNTLEILDKCNLEFKFTGYNLAKYDIPKPEQDSYEHLKYLSYQGLVKKGLIDKKEYIDRVETELEVFHLMGQEDYMLIVSDYVSWANSNGVATGPGRGSACASLVAYLLGITKIDPIEYGLLFIRFISKGRSLNYSFFD
jgi:DNA polymerase-3 subunit alpha